MSDVREIRARAYAREILHEGMEIKVINPSGTQVVDLWAIPMLGKTSWLSMAQCRQAFGRLRPTVGDSFVDTLRRPILTLVEDTSSGIHDMLYPPCDPIRYKEAGHDRHDSCAKNLRSAMKEMAGVYPKDPSRSFPIVELEEKMRTWEWAPEPLNLFMNVAVNPAVNASDKGHLEVKRPNCEKNGYVILRAEMDCLVVMSACPNDILDTNGGEPGPAAFQIIEK